MIYDSNDLSILFLPDKKINYWQYRDLIAQKRRAINRDGRYLTNSPKRRVSSPLYRIETANGPMFVHCVLGTLYRKFTNIGQMVSLYIGDEGPDECYADNQKALLIVSLICLGVNILFIFIMILVKIM